MAQADGTVMIDTRIDDDGIKKGTKNLEKEFNGLGKTATKNGGKIKDALGKTVKAGAKIGLAAITSVGAALAGLTTKALEAAGELEQNIGGSEAVFKDSAESMQRIAKQAYKNMGLSASDYLATANKIGAILQGSGYDIAESMDLTTKAMQRAADVASVMGVSTEEAMDAITGAAKGNFEMMDNLGVKMNATAIEAYALEKGITKSYEAMSEQEKIGLAMEMFLDKTAYATGNYAKENDTLAGSLATAKAAFDNFLSGAGDIDGLVDSFVAAAGAISENVSKILPGLTAGLSQLMTELIPYIPPLLEELIPAAIEGFGLIAAGLAEAAPDLFAAVGNGVIKAIFGDSMDMTPATEAMTRLETAVQPLSDAITNGLGWAYDNVLVPLASWTISEVVPGLMDALSGALTAIYDAGVALQPIAQWLWDSFLQPVSEWAGDAIVGLLQGFADALQTIGSNISENQESFQALVTIVGSFAAAWVLVNAAVTAWTAISGLAATATTAFGAAVAFLTSPIGIAITIIGSLIAIGALLAQNWDEISAWLKETWTKIKDKAVEIFGNVKTFFSDTWAKIKEKVTTIATNIRDSLSNTWQNLKDKTVTAFNTVKSKVTDAFTSLKNAIKSPINAIIGFINKLISGVVNGINGMIRAMNRLSFDVPSWVPIIGGNKFGFNIKTLTAPQIPYLASGAVIPPRSEFLAVLGDQKSGTNIETPEKLLRDLFRQEFAAAMGGGGGRTYQFIAQIDGTTVFNKMISEAQLRRTSSGRNPFEL